MMRILFGSALPILGLGAAAAFIGPDLVSAPRGEPLVVAAPQNLALQRASFDGTACASTLVLGEDRLLQPGATGGAHVVTLAFRTDASGASVVIERGETDPADAPAVVLVFDDAGRILSVTPTQSERERMLADAYAADCLGREDNGRPSGV